MTITQAIGRSSALHTVLAILGGAALLAASAQLRVPMWPVPTTMQTFAVLLVGASCGPAVGGGAVLAYLTAAGFGLPVLAGGAALGGPTLGYLAGFLLAATMLGAARDHGWLWRPLGLLAALLAAQAMIYLAGLSWLRFAWSPDVPSALQAGLLPFLPADAAKLALAYACLRLLPLLGR